MLLEFLLVGDKLVDASDGVESGDLTILIRHVQVVEGGGC